MKKSFTLWLFVLVFSLSGWAQVSIKDSSIYTPLVGASYGYYLSGADMLKRFGSSSAAALNIDFKTKKYWMFGVNGSYIFGNKVYESLFDSISTSTGGIISEAGQFADIRLYERGFTVSATAGKMFHFDRPNPNSGVVATIGLGFIQHKIRIETIGNNVPQLSKEYKKGYDRLTNGLLISENLGYLYLSNNRLWNIYLGLEFQQGITKNRRAYNFDEMRQDDRQRLDVLYGAKLMWILPLYKKAPQEFYTY